MHALLLSVRQGTDEENPAEFDGYAADHKLVDMKNDAGNCGLPV
jgi:hypothetical protein